MISKKAVPNKASMALAADCTGIDHPQSGPSIASPATLYKIPLVYSLSLRPGLLCSRWGGGMA